MTTAPGPADAPTSRIPGLDALRALAVFLVLAEHSGWRDYSTIGFFDGGFGVELFFVLSGFLITRGLLAEYTRTGGLDLLWFYRRRAARLFPAFYAYLVLGGLAVYLSGQALPWGAMLAASLYVINYYQAFTGAEAHYLSHCWSLAVEEQFYLVWPPILLGLAMLGRRWAVSIGALVLLFVAWRMVAVFIIQAPDAYLYRALEVRADQLAIGGLLAAVYSERLVEYFRSRQLLSGVAALVICCLILCSTTFLRPEVTLKYGAGYVLEPLLVACLIPVVVGLASGHTWTGSFLRAPVLVWMGRVSYGIYLYHQIALHVAAKRIGHWVGEGIAADVLAMLVVVAVASASFVLFEEPVRKYLSGPRAAHRVAA